MSTGLIRLQNKGHLHFITFSCFRHRPILGTPQSRDTFLELLERFRLSYKFEVIGYVVMPDHVHLILSEPEAKPLSTAIQVLKQTFSRTRLEPDVWESRYYDFNIYTASKLTEKLTYIHLNPVRRALVTDPAHWLWSSFRHYAQIHPTSTQLITNSPYKALFRAAKP